MVVQNLEIDKIIVFCPIKFIVGFDWDSSLRFAAFGMTFVFVVLGEQRAALPPFAP